LVLDFSALKVRLRDRTSLFEGLLSAVKED